ncbi:MAG TPA: hypothetical protein VGB94_13635 [Acidobacteriaceae bacterium]
MNIRKIVAVGLGVGVVAVFALAAANWLSAPLDKALRARFFARRADFERLVAMANEDSHLDRIAPDFIGPEDGFAQRKDVGITEERWNEYRQLFHATGVSTGIKKDINPSRIFFPIDSRGLVPTGAAKGFVYSQAPLSPVLKSLDKSPPDKLYDGPDRSHALVYKPIEDHWYIYYEEW